MTLDLSYRPHRVARFRGGDLLDEARRWHEAAATPGHGGRSRRVFKPVVVGMNDGVTAQDRAPPPAPRFTKPADSSLLLTACNGREASETRDQGWTLNASINSLVRWL